MKQIFQRTQPGFTLVEVLIVMGLLSIMLVVVTDIFTTTVAIQGESEATSAVSQDGRTILARLDYDVRRASAVTTPAALGGSGSSLVLVIGGANYTYALSGSNLQLTNTNGTDNLNGNAATISALNFQRLGNSGGKDTIQVSFTVTGKNKPRYGPQVQTFTTTVGRR